MEVLTPGLSDLEVLFSIFIPLAVSSLNLFAPMFSNMTMETESVYSLIISTTTFFFFPVGIGRVLG